MQRKLNAISSLLKILIHGSQSTKQQHTHTHARHSDKKKITIKNWEGATATAMNTLDIYIWMYMYRVWQRFLINEYWKLLTFQKWCITFKLWHTNCFWRVLEFVHLLILINMNYWKLCDNQNCCHPVFPLFFFFFQILVYSVEFLKSHRNGNWFSNAMLTVTIAWLKMIRMKNQIRRIFSPIWK